MKKILALMLAVVMVAAMFAGCSQKSPTEPTKAPEPTTEATKAPEPTTEATKAPEPTTEATEAPEPTTEATEATKAEPETTAAAEPAAADITSWILEDDTSISGTVNFWIPFKGTQGMDAMIADFNKTYPNITVNLNTYSNNGDGNVAVNTAIMGGEVDVLASFGINNAYKRWENGLYLDLTDRIAEENIDMVANWGSDAYQYDGSYYTLPCGGLTYYIAINMTAWNEAGLGEIPTEWTWDEYLEACRKMTKLNDDGTVAVYGGSDYHSTNIPMYAYCQVKGGDMYYVADGSASSFMDPIVVNAYNREVKAELEEKIWFPKATYRADSIQAQMTFCQGKTASTVICNVTRFLHDKNTYPDVNWITGFAPWPVEEKGQTNYMSGVPNYSHAGITLNCQDEDAAWAFLKWYSTYGSKYLAAAGHLSAWRGTDPNGLIDVIYGSEEEAKKWIDVESFTRVVGRTDLPSYVEKNLTALSDVVTTGNDAFMQIINGLETPEEALQKAQATADELIKNG